MNVVMAPDVQLIAEFMQSNLTTDRLVEVSKSLSSLSEVLWGHYPRIAAPAVQLRLPPLSESMQPVATE
jgi:hypothetical protein